MTKDDSFKKAKEDLVKRLRSKGYLKTTKVENALRAVPREEFIPQSARRNAYRDSPLPIGHGQTISAPHMCVIMCEALELEEGMKVLEVGAGSGYHAALCAEIIAGNEVENPGHVYTVEIVEALISYARDNLERTGYAESVTLFHGDGGDGLPENAPYDRVLVVAAAPSVPAPLVEQLRPGGRMLIPVGKRGFYQELMLIEKSLEGQVHEKRWGGVAFVPLTGKYGVR